MAWSHIKAFWNNLKKAIQVLKIIINQVLLTLEEMHLEKTYQSTKIYFKKITKMLLHMNLDLTNLKN